MPGPWVHEAGTLSLAAVGLAEVGDAMLGNGMQGERIWFGENPGRLKWPKGTGEAPRLNRRALGSILNLELPRELVEAADVPQHHVPIAAEVEL